jgi:ribosomal protein L16 Arg81 hydroxylase
MGNPMEADRFDLAKLLWPIEPETFFRDSWEKQPLAVSRNDPTWYHGLFSRRDVDSVIAYTRPRFLGPDNFKPDGPPRINFVRGSLTEHTPVGYYPDLPDVHRAFAQGKTLVLDAMHHRWLAVAAMCRHLEAFFGCPVQTNLYLTPPGAQGFAAHFDTHEVFVLQIDGDKHWRFYGVARDLPLARDQAAIQKDKLGRPTQEVFLKPGDLLYMPRGHVHEAFTSDRASLHLTVGVMVFRWLDLLEQALHDTAANDVRFRQSLPLGLLCRDVTPRAVNEKFHELLQVFAGSAALKDAVGAMAETFVGRLAALPQDYFAIDDPDRINPDTVLERAPGVICRVVQKGDKVTLHAPGGGIDGPLKIAQALHYIARTERFAPRALPDDLTENAKLVLVRRLVREKVLKIAIPSASAAREP